MCSIESKIILCTCKGSSKKVRKNKKEDNRLHYHTWKLNKVAGPSQIMMDGMLMLPEDNITYLNGDFLLHELNSRNCFDFEFIPQENDNLMISSNNNTRSFLSFIYNNGTWVKGIHNTFLLELEKINSGKIKIE